MNTFDMSGPINPAPPTLCSNPQCKRPLLSKDSRCSHCGFLRYDASLKGFPPRLPEGFPLRNYEIQIQRYIGGGSYSSVYEAEEVPIRRKVALKELRPLSQHDKKNREWIEREISIHASLGRTSYFPAVYSYFDEQDYTYIVMELIQGRTLARAMKEQRFPPLHEVARIGLVLAQMLAFLAELKPPIIFGDLSPTNIILKSEAGKPEQPVTIDFGMALQDVPEQHLSYKTPGTQGFKAPELEQHSGNRTNKIDVYSLGKILNFLLSGKNIEQSSSDPQKLEADDIQPEKVAFYKLINEMIRRDPKKRPEPRTIVERLEPLLDQLKDLPLERPEVAQGELYYTFNRHAQGMSSRERYERKIHVLAWSPDGVYLASASNDKSVELWKAHDGMPLRTYREHHSPVTALAWSHNSCYLASAGLDCVLHVWTARTEQGSDNTLDYRCRGHSRWIRAVAWSPDDRRIVSCSDDQMLLLWDAQTGQLSGSYRLKYGRTSLLSERQKKTNSYLALAWSPDGSQIAVGRRDSLIEIFTLAADQFKLAQILKGHTDEVVSLAWSSDGSRLISGSWDHTVRFWDMTAGGRLLWTHSAHSQLVMSVGCFLVESALFIASASKDGSVHILDSTGKQIFSYAQPVLDEGGISALACFGKGARVASAGEDGMIEVWKAV